MGSGKILLGFFFPFYVGFPIWTSWEMLLSNFWPQKAVNFFKGLCLGLLLTCLLKLQPILSSLGLFVLEPVFLFHCDFLPVSFLFQPKSYRETNISLCGKRCFASSGKKWMRFPVSSLAMWCTVWNLPFLRWDTIWRTSLLLSPASQHIQLVSEFCFYVCIFHLCA